MNSASHLLYLTRNIRVSQGKHAHLHKYAVKHTHVAPGCSCGDGGVSETSPASQLTSHLRMLCKKKKERGKKKERREIKAKCRSVQIFVRMTNMFRPNGILQVRKSVFIRL